jgi:hypothetical protein
MEISIYAPYAKERLNSASTFNLYLERIVGKPEVVQAGSDDQYREVLVESDLRTWHQFRMDYGRQVGRIAFRFPSFSSYQETCLS